MLREKLKDMHDEVRRRHKINILTDLRAGLLESLPTQQINKLESPPKSQMVNENQHFLNLNAQDMILVDLISLARYSQKQQNIMQIKQLLFQQKITKFMGEDYIDTDEQFYASFVLSNLFCKSSTPPNEQLTYNLMYLLQNADALTIQNCLYIVQNVASDFPHWRDRVVTENGLAQILYDLFMAEHVGRRQLDNLMAVAYCALQNSKPNNSFKALQKPLCHLILSLSLEDLNLIKKAMNCLSLIVCMFPQQTGRYITKSTIIVRLMNIFFQVEDKLFAYKTLNFIKACLQTMPFEIFHNKVMPLILELHSRQYEIGKISLSVDTAKIQLSCYNIIFLALQSNIMQVNSFYPSQLAKSMLQVLDQTQDCLIVEELVRIFMLVLINNSKAIIEFKPAIYNAKQRFPNNIQIMSFIEYVDNLLETFL